MRHIQNAQVGVLHELAIQALKPVVGQVEGAQVVLQAIRQLPQSLPGAVHVSVAVAAGAHGGTHSQDVQPQQQHKHKFQKGLIKKKPQQRMPTEKKMRERRLAFIEHSLPYEH